MSKTFRGDIIFPNNFDVQTTRPLDVRLVVDSKEDLTNGTIEAPYQGMVVNVKGTSELWVLMTDGIENSHDPENWKLVTGSGGGSGLSKYSIPVMTPEMFDDAVTDPSVDFGDSDECIIIDDEHNTDDDNPDIFYKGIIQDMYRSIMALQTEVTRLKNSFEYGIVSYKNTDTAWGKHREEITVDEDEPLWAIEPGYLTLVDDNPNFVTSLDVNGAKSFLRKGDSGTIDVSVDDQLTFNDGEFVFYDGLKSTASKEELTLYHLNDSKLITYLVTNKPDIKINLIPIPENDDSITQIDTSSIRNIDFSSLLGGITTNKYGICIIISRKQKTDGETYKGFNYVYFSIIDYNTNRKLCEGYLNKNSDTLSSDRVLLDDNRYVIHSLEFNRLTLYRMKFYTKYEDFSSGWEEKEDEIISNPPSEYQTTYEAAHIAIRSVKNTEVLDSVADELLENELIWNKEKKALYIKSDGKIYRIGSNSGQDDEHNKDTYMTDIKLIEALEKMGIIVNNPVYKEDEDGELTILDKYDSISMNPIADITFVNQDTNKRFTFTVDPEGNLVGKDKSAQTIEEYLTEIGKKSKYDNQSDYKAVRGFSSDYLFMKTNSPNTIYLKDDAGKLSDRLRISSFYAPIITDDTHGCTHSFVEIENSSEVDIPLTGIYLHFYNPGAVYDSSTNKYSGKVYHLALDGVCKAGGTYLIRGAKHAEFDDASAFIKVKTYDKEWYDNGEPVSFEQIAVKVSTDSSGNESVDSDSPINSAYRFCLTYGLPDLAATDRLVTANASGGTTIGENTYDFSTYPNLIVNPRFIDSCSFSTASSVCANTSTNPWYINGKGGVGIQIKKNTMFRLTFALDPAKQAFNGFNGKDSSRIRYNKGQDLQVLDLSKEFIGYPHSNETIKIERYTPKASFENRNVMTDKSPLNKEKPNMVTCSFGLDVYNTRCFNWISCGTFDEYVWVRQQGTTAWTGFQSYTKVSSNTPEDHSKSIYRKEYLKDVNNAGYARMINRFPGNDVLFTSHKCVIVLPDVQSPTVYEYVVGRPDKDNNPDFEHTNSIYTFTLYPRTYEGRVYQVTDQQGFHWIEYQVWAASAEFLNTKITQEISEINSVAGNTKVFPILINTGDMTQSGARINEWLDYYNGGVSLFNHLEQMNCVGNNDLCPINPRDLGTGNDNDKSSSHFFHYFYCFDVRDTEKCTETTPDQTKPDQKIYTGEKFFTGESLVVKAHTGHFGSGASEVNINVEEDKFIPSFYYFKTTKVLYIMVNSEIPESNCKFWFGLCSNKAYVNIYTGIEIVADGEYVGSDNCFTPLYETMYAWLDGNAIKSNGTITGSTRKSVVAMHEMPFTVITNESLYKGTTTNIPCTRNFPTKKGRLGSNTNQLNINENRGIFWCSRLLEYFGCKLVIGGHKHTYALSYPIKEKYTWSLNGATPVDSGTQIKTMLSTLADEAGLNPQCLVSWNIESTPENNSAYNFSGDESLNSTKTPYIPNGLYNEYGKAITDNSTDFVRCCTPTSSYNEKYDGFVSYSMCQATGYKLKSNKELPAPTQVFSKIIPMTTYKQDNTTKAFTDKPSPEQLYPMYSILEFEYDGNGNVNGISITMNRITGIFKKDGEDKFNQSAYGTKTMTRQCLCTYEKEDCDSYGTDPNSVPSGQLRNGYLYFDTANNKVMKYVITTSSSEWQEVRERMYGKWLTEAAAKTRLNQYLANPSTVSDNRYLHIKY